MTDNKLQVLIAESGLEETKAKTMLDQFANSFEFAAKWEARAKEIVVTSALQTDEMAMARTGRLLLRDKRIAIEKTRKQLKEQALREGKAIDGIANVLKELIVPIEEHLIRQEKFVEFKEQAEAEERERLWLKAEEKARLEREEAERKEQERVKAENEKLRQEAIRREEAHKKEQTRLEKARKAAERKVVEEKARAKAKAEKQKKEASAKLEAERVKREETERKASAETLRIQTEANKQKALADAKLRAEQLKREQAEREASAQKKIALQKLQAEQAERQRIEAELAAQIECPKCHHKFNPAKRVA